MRFDSGVGANVLIPFVETLIFRIVSRQRRWVHLASNEVENREIREKGIEKH